jgi:hypothetical protein
MIVTTSAEVFGVARVDDNKKDGAFGKRNRVRALITSLQIPFVMLR